jgi:hypothetical protein
MPNETARTRIHIVPQPRRAPISPQDFIEPSAQGMLFPTPRQGLMIFILFPDVTEQEFRETLKCAMPSYVIELRTSPRFDIGNLNRNLAFQTFQYQNITYLDLASSLMGNVDPESLIYKLREFLQTNRPRFDRPIIFLINRIESDEGLVPRVLETLSAFDTEPKYVFEVPRFQGPAVSDYRLASL